MPVGATARDLLPYHVFGHAVTRATYDLDFAILVDSWEQFAIVKQLFLDIPGFTDKGRNAQRLYYQPAGGSFETIIDMIPFGKLETVEGTIASCRVALPVRTLLRPDFGAMPSVL